MGNSGSVYFDRDSNQYLSLADASQTGFDDLSACTMEMDVRIDVLSPFSFSSLARKSDVTTVSWRCEYWYTNYIRVVIDGTGGQSVVNSGALDMVLGNWYHVAWTFDGADVNIYVDGELSINQAVSTSHIQESPGTPVELFTEGIQKITGYMDNFRFWDVARSGPEIKAHRFREVGAESNVVCSLPFTSDLTDLTANDNDFTAPNGATLSSEVPWDIIPARAIAGGVFPGGIGFHT